MIRLLSAVLLLSLAAPLGAQTAALPDAPAAPGQTATPKLHDFVPRPIPREPRPVLPPAEIATQIDAFFKGLEGNEVRKSYTAFLAGSRLANRDEDVSTFVDRTQQALAIYGKVNDFEVYDTRQIGSRILVTTYFTALTVAPIRWRFIYYKPRPEMDPHQPRLRRLDAGLAGIAVLAAGALPRGWFGV